MITRVSLDLAFGASAYLSRSMIALPGLSDSLFVGGLGRLSRGAVGRWSSGRSGTAGSRRARLSVPPAGCWAVWPRGRARIDPKAAKAGQVGQETRLIVVLMEGRRPAHLADPDSRLVVRSDPGANAAELCQFADRCHRRQLARRARFECFGLTSERSDAR